MQEQGCTYLAIVGDHCVAPTNERAHRQRELEWLMNQFNTTYAESIVARFVVTIGDEFQVLLKDARAETPLATFYIYIYTRELSYTVK